MSIDIDWENLTTGPDGLALAESIREFIHDKFQQVDLPRFIRSVQVHSFDFGTECPVVELKDICDPLPDFYEEDGSDEEEAVEEGVEDEQRARLGRAHENGGPTRQHLEGAHSGYQFTSSRPALLTSRTPSFIDTRIPGFRPNFSLADQLATPLLSRSNTPGIPGGTSNLSYFHLPLSAGLSGAQTPLVAVAGGNPHTLAWQDHHAPPWENHPRHSSPQRNPYLYRQDHVYADPLTRPSTAISHGHPLEGHHRRDTLDGVDERPTSETRRQEPSPLDLQIVLHVSYSGSIRLSLTAEILLDYPMPSFVGIPLKLNITGLSFDGVALIAYLSKRAHFCFLGQEDAEALLDANTLDHHNGPDEQRGGDTAKVNNHGDNSGGLLREIRVESEIGQKEGGKQVLKNVGKVEKFVLEQVRRIFEDEFVYPSFWTFLV
ncbi:MAG: hypothetical protein Q9187_008748 [Circinaria calcarea]